MCALKLILLLVIATLILSACGAVTPYPSPKPSATAISPTMTATLLPTPRPPWTTPHPILSDIRVRHAIAYCTDKDALIASAYPLLTPEERESLIMDSFVPRNHWAYAGEEYIEFYSFDPQKGMALLEEAGWKLRKEGEIRVNAKGENLFLKLETTSATFRQTWVAVWVEQMKTCGIQIKQYVPPVNPWFEDRDPGQEIRDFELQVHAWISQPDPRGRYLYTCDQIPTSENGWTGLNWMGWCNPLASESIIRANRTLLRQERVDAYRIFQREFTKDMVSLPLFNRAETFAMDAHLQGADLGIEGSLYWWHNYLWNIADWELSDKDTIVIGLTQEPASLFTIVEEASAAHLTASLIDGVKYTNLDYDYLPIMQKQISTLESGLAVNNTVMVHEGDVVFDAHGFTRILEQDMQVVIAEGNMIEYAKGSSIAMKQLVVKYEFADGLIWSDGVPVTSDDFQLYYKITCDKDSNAVLFYICDSVQKIEFTDNGYTIWWIPGLQETETYGLAPLGFFPAHRRLSDGRLLADLPAKEWATTEEVAKSPIGAGPYVLKEWIPGDRIVFEANPYYYAGPPKTKTIVIKFLIPAIAESSLILGNVDFLGSETLAGVSESLKAAEEAGLIRIVIVPSGTWEHIDMNLFIK